MPRKTNGMSDDFSKQKLKGKKKYISCTHSIEYVEYVIHGRINDSAHSIE
jgi:hypothetical protein